MPQGRKARFLDQAVPGLRRVRKFCFHLTNAPAFDKVRDRPWHEAHLDMAPSKPPHDAHCKPVQTLMDSFQMKGQPP
eukprot:4155228-Pyramimonas_sp.AAC.1